MKKHKTEVTFPITSQSPSFSHKSRSSKSSHRSGSSTIQQHVHLHQVVEEKKSKYNDEDDEDDDMEVMSVNDQPQFLNHTTGKNNLSQNSESRESNKLVKSINASIKKYSSSDVKNSVHSSKGSLASSKDLHVSDDTIPLKLKKKPNSDPFEDEQLPTHIDMEENYIEEDFSHDEEESVTNSSNSLHILTTVRQKLGKGQVANSNKDNKEKPSKMAEYIKRFRTAPPTKRSERKRLDENEIEENIETPKMEQNWKTKFVTESNDNIHPSILNIRNLKESIKNEIREVDDDIRMARRHKPSEVYDQDLSPQVFSLKEKFSYIDTLDVDIAELNNMTDEALENGSFHLFNEEERKKTNSTAQNSSVLSKNTTDSEEDYEDLFEENIRTRLKSIGLSDSILGIDHLRGELSLEKKADSLIKQKEKSIVSIDPKDILDKDDRDSLYNSATNTSKISSQKLVTSVIQTSEPRGGPTNEENTNQKLRDQQQSKDNNVQVIPATQQNKSSTNIESILGQSLQSISSVTSLNDNDISIGGCQRMIEEMVTSQDFSPNLSQPIDINDDNHELFTSDYICQTLRQKIEFLKKKLLELEAQR
ncbi:hypothetical protein C9374_003362 [Naegleria lovaniensis]|uniref:Uncharacterized protein n=1 Tax=Naegleria lovaniensis TaxID=51637 RepID=A0AA88GR74_NAELO|nr:uncharacterized protein C9374_003362 [Naegleria lovaniensis]KAG2385547.1 hypothetical protein C9374_003362 [Naegleria lovaniensis]